MFVRKVLLTAAAAAASLAVGAPAWAGLEGSTVATQYYAYGGAYIGGGQPATFVANGTPQNQFADAYTLTVFDDRIEYDYLSTLTWSFSPQSFAKDGLRIANGNLLTFTGAPPIVAVTLDPASDMAGFDATRITFNQANVAVDWMGLSANPGTRVVLDVETVPVPEPSGFALLCAGAGMLALLALRLARRSS